MEALAHLPQKIAAILFSLGMLFAAMNLPKGPPPSASAQLAFPFIHERKVRYPTYPFGAWSKRNEA